MRLIARNMAGFDRIRRRLHPVVGPAQRLARKVPRNTPNRARAHIAAHYDLGNDLFSDVPRRAARLLLRVLPALGRHARGGPGGEARADLRAARARPGRSPARDRDRLGRACRPRRGGARVPRHDHHDLPRAARVRDGAGPRAGPRGPRHGAGQRLPRPGRRVRRARLGRDDRGRRVAVLPAFFRKCSELLRAGRADAAAGDRDRRRGLRGREGVAELRQHARCSPAAACRPSA